MTDLVPREQRGAAVHLVLNRPDKLNSLNVPLFEALDAHVRDIAAESAKFADTHARWALTPVWGLSQRLPRRVGTSKAREMMFTCRTYSGREAEAMGLANACFPDETFLESVDAWVAEIAANSAFSHAANKRLLDLTDGLPLPAGLAHEVYRGEGVGPDMRERIAAFAARKGG